jgi:hypothetical protein
MHIIVAAFLEQVFRIDKCKFVDRDNRFHDFCAGDSLLSRAVEAEKEEVVDWSGCAAIFR